MADILDFFKHSDRPQTIMYPSKCIEQKNSLDYFS